MDCSVINKINNTILNKHCSLLCVGPMSKNCVDAAIEIANENNIPIILIASRRQIDSKEFGGGYVNNWATDEYAKYVRSKDKRNNIILARDHGGPWQSEVEKKTNLDLREAMNSAKSSFKSDIDAGFQMIHIDPSIDIHQTPAISEVIDRVFELYDFCYSYAKQNNKDIIFEIGTEEQTGSSNSQEEVEYILSEMDTFCKKNKFPKPNFIVVQTGTRVMETRNIGIFDYPFRVENQIPAEIQIPKILEICSKYDIFIKEHNADYLSDEGLRWHPKLGIHSVNIAPEFGVIETKALLSILEQYNLKDLFNEFINESFNSKKWEKWLLKNSSLSKLEKSIISGHYVFSSPKVIEIKSHAKRYLQKKGIDLEFQLKEIVKEKINHILRQFRVL